MDLLKNLDFDTPYKVVLYLFGVIFVFSFFKETSDVEIIKLRLSSGLVVMLGLITWVVDEFYKKQSFHSFYKRFPPLVISYNDPFKSIKYQEVQEKCDFFSEFS